METVTPAQLFFFFLLAFTPDPLSEAEEMHYLF